MQRHMPLGYKLVDGKIQLDTPKSDAVIQIFQGYASGESLIRIAEKLASRGFLNANNQPNWYHGTVSKILENVKYKGDGFFPRLIEPELFEKVQNRRKEQSKKLGRNLQLNSMSRQSVFSGVLSCGECGDVYRKYVEHSGKTTKRILWKCKKYIYENRVCCCNCFLTDEQIILAFLSAINRVLDRKLYLNYKPKKQSTGNNREFEKLDQKIKELEAGGRYSSRELPALVFNRAKAFYQTAQVEDHAYNTEKMIQALSGMDNIKRFDEDLFSKVIRQVTICKEGKLTFEFINGLPIQVEIPRLKKDGERM